MFQSSDLNNTTCEIPRLYSERDDYSHVNDLVPKLQVVYESGFWKTRCDTEYRVKQS